MGTGNPRPYFGHGIPAAYCFLKFRSAPQRSSLASVRHWHWLSLRFFPHTGQIPLQ